MVCVGPLYESNRLKHHWVRPGSRVPLGSGGRGEVKRRRWLSQAEYSESNGARCTISAWWRNLKPAGAEPSHSANGACIACNRRCGLITLLERVVIRALNLASKRCNISGAVDTLCCSCSEREYPTSPNRVTIHSSVSRTRHMYLCKRNYKLDLQANDHGTYHM